MSRILLSALLFPAALVAAQPPQAPQVPQAFGNWEGAIELPGSKLGIQVQLLQEKGAFVGRISIPDQGAKDLPLDKLNIQGSKVSFALCGVPGNPTLAGDLSADGGGISGTFSQGGQSFPFKLTRVGADAAKIAQALEGLEAQIEKMRKDWKVPGLAVAIVKGGNVVYAKGHGLRDVAKNLPMTPDTLLPIASCTKAFTTAVMASLVDEGKLEWEKPVRTWIPWFKLQDPVATDRMTPLDLVTHRSGLPRHDVVGMNPSLSLEEMVRRLQYLEPNKDFRAAYQYNNLMVDTAGYLTEVVGGQTWEESVKTRIFEPLGMLRTNFSVDATQRNADFSQPYRKEEDGTVKQIPYCNMPSSCPSGSINSSVKDMAAWVQLHLQKGKVGGKQVLSPESVSFLHKPQMLTGDIGPDRTAEGYAPGWCTDVYRGHQRIHHGGDLPGFAAMVMMVPSADMGVVVLTNMQGTPTREYVPRLVIDRFLGLEVKDWSGEALKNHHEVKGLAKEAEAKKKATRKVDTKPSHALDDFAGTYSHPGYGDLNVILQKDRLSWTYNAITTPLEHWHFDTFNSMKGEEPLLEDLKLHFRIGLDGEVEAVESAMEPAVKPIVFTKKADARLSDPKYLQRLVGTYALSSDEQMIVTLRGNVLVAKVSGQDATDLVPARGMRFTLKEAPFVTMKFTLPESGSATLIEVDQPNGVYTLKRKS